MSCKESGFWIDLSTNVILHALILFLILSLLFWLYISKISSEAITNEVNDNIDKAFTTYKASLTQEQLMTIRTYVKNNPKIFTILQNIYSQPDAVQQTNNQWLQVFNISWITLLIVALCILLITLYLSCSVCVPIVHMIKENLVLFALIGVVEFLFFTKIALKYIPAPPSLIITSFLNRLQNFN